MDKYETKVHRLPQEEGGRCTADGHCKKNSRVIRRTDSILIWKKREQLYFMASTRYILWSSYSKCLHAICIWMGLPSIYSYLVDTLSNSRQMKRRLIVVQVSNNNTQQKMFDRFKTISHNKLKNQKSKRKKNRFIFIQFERTHKITLIFSISRDLILIFILDSLAGEKSRETRQMGELTN